MNIFIASKRISSYRKKLSLRRGGLHHRISGNFRSQGPGLESEYYDFTVEIPRAGDYDEYDAAATPAL